MGVFLIIHLIGLMLGAGGGFGSMVAMQYANRLPAEQQPVVRGLGPILAKVSLVGLALMWATGVWMFMLFGDIGTYPWSFWAKMVFVGTLTLAAIAVELIYGQVRRGNVKAAAWLPRLGPVAGISSLLAVIFAVLTFDP